MPSATEDKHARLQELLRDRKSSTKGRASRRMAICLSTELSMDLEDARAELAAANEAVANATANGTPRAGGRVPVDGELTKRVTAAEKAVADAEAAVDAASVTITFVALKAADYDDLLKKHPPREGNELDAAMDYDRDSFPDALMEASASPKIEDADGDLVKMEIADLIAEFSDGERALACRIAFDVNQRTSSFSDAKSQSRQRSGANSKRR
jgi:hypothetical protein